MSHSNVSILQEPYAIKAGKNQHPRNVLKDKQLHFRELLRQQRLYRRSEQPLPHASPYPPTSTPYQLTDIHLADRLRALDFTMTRQVATFNANWVDHNAALTAVLAEFDVLCALAVARQLKDLRLKHYFPAKAVEICRRLKKHPQNIDRIQDMSLAEYGTAINDAQTYPYIDGAVHLHWDHLRHIQQWIPLLPQENLVSPSVEPQTHPHPQEPSEEDRLEQLNKVLRDMRLVQNKLEEMQRRFSNTGESMAGIMATMQHFDHLCVNLLRIVPHTMSDVLYLSPLAKSNVNNIAAVQRDKRNPTCSTSQWRKTVTLDDFSCQHIYQGGLLDDVFTSVHLKMKKIASRASAVQQKLPSPTPRKARPFNNNNEILGHDFQVRYVDTVRPRSKQRSNIFAESNHCQMKFNLDATSTFSTCGITSSSSSAHSTPQTQDQDFGFSPPSSPLVKATLPQDQLAPTVQDQPSPSLLVKTVNFFIMPLISNVVGRSR
ncbi:hypothetical protein CF319_g9109 [Tilletia indica]|nr:hypothetical protein CF319_g9109 [Tilletia indica]